MSEQGAKRPRDDEIAHVPPVSRARYALVKSNTLPHGRMASAPTGFASSGPCPTTRAFSS